MSEVFKLNGSTLPSSRVFYDYAGAEDWEMSQDATGPSGGQGTLVLQDPTGDLTVRTWMPFVQEESASSQPRLATSWITKVTERRGSYLTGVGRELVCELADPNVLLGLRLIAGSDGNRPSETDTARLAWLIGSACLDGIVFDTGYITGNGTTFDATDYRGKFATDVLSDLSRGRIYFAFWDPAALEVGLFFDLPDTTIWTSTISVSNVAADVNNSTVFALSDDATWERDGEGVYSTIRYEYLGANLTVHNSTTASTFFPSPLLDRGETVDTPNVGKTATAVIQANLLLAQASDEAKTLKGRIWLPAAQAGLFLAGQRASFRASHFTGLTSATYLHLKRVTYKPWADHPGYYEVNFEASNFGITGTTGGPSGGPGPSVPPQTSSPLYDDCLTYVGYPAPFPSSLPTVVHFYNGDVYSAAYTVTQAPDDGESGIVTYWERSSGVGIPYGSHSFGHPAGTVTATESFTMSGLATGGEDFMFTGGTSTDLGKSGAGMIACCVLSLTTPGPENPNPPTGGANPKSGSPILGEVVATGDGSTTSFTTDFTFVPGSLKVYVDLLDQTAGLTASDGAAMTFTLGFAPKLGEQITVDYIKAP